MRQTDSEVVRQVLADGVITDEELLEVRQAAVSCITDRGFPARLFGDGIEVTTPAGASSTESDDAYAACTRKTTALVWPLYEGITSNPNNIALPQLRLECLQRMGILDKSMTIDQYNAIDFDNPPWNKLSGDAMGCFDDPANYNGGRPDLLPSEVEGGLSATAQAPN